MSEITLVINDRMVIPNSGIVLTPDDTVLLLLPSKYGGGATSGFFFAHVTDAAGCSRSADMEKMEEADGLLVCVWRVADSLPLNAGAVQVQFSVEDKGATLWQSETVEYTLSVGGSSGATGQSAVAATAVTFAIATEAGGDSDVIYMAESDASTAAVDSVKPPVIVTGRSMAIPAEVVRAGVAGDRNAESVTFICDRYYDGQDLGGKHWYVEVSNAQGEYDIVAPTVTLGDATVTAEWVIGARHAYYDGKVQVRLRATDGETFIWQTYTGEFTIYKTFAQTEALPQPGLSAVEDALEKLGGVQNLYNQIMTDYENGAFTGATGASGKNGADGKAATVKVGTVATGEPGTNAEVTNSGTEAAAVLDFKIPRGGIEDIAAKSATGQIVQLDGLMAGMPLSVTARTVSAQTTMNVWRGGRNIVNHAVHNYLSGGTRVLIDKGVRVTTTITGNVSITYHLPLMLLGQTITVKAKMSIVSGDAIGQRLWIHWGSGSNTSQSTIVTQAFSDGKAQVTVTLPNTMPAGAEWLGLRLYPNYGTATAGVVVDFTEIQLEIGSVATDYEAYAGATYAVTLPVAGQAASLTIPSISGLNTVYTDAGGETTVAVPGQIEWLANDITTLKNALIALGGSI